MRIALHGFAAAVALTSVLAGAPALAQSGQRNLIELGQRQYEDLHYEEAVQTLSAAIIRPGNSPQDELRIYELLAYSYQALQRNDEAEGAWRLVLARDPTRQPSQDISPRVQQFFTRVRERWEAEGRPGVARPNNENTNDGTQQPANALPEVRIEHRSPPQQQRGRAVPLTATVVDPGNRVSRLVLAYRHNNSGIFRRVDAQAQSGGAFAVTLPGEVVRPPLVEYYFEAVDATGVPVQARGDAFAPLRIAVPEPGRIPWWVWVGGGVLVAGAVTGIVIGVVSASGSQPATLNINVVGN
jgi:tetratricopeptide (TPR) repeat protein